MPSGPDVRLEPATVRDVPLLLQLIKSLADYEHLSDQVVATEDGLRESLFGERAQAETVLAYVGDVPVGFAVFFHNYSTFLGRAGLYLEDLFVLPDWRRQGVGRRLFGHVAQLAVSRKCGRLEWSVLDWNEPAIRFYKAVGAQPMDEWTVFRLTGAALERFAGGGS